MISINPLILLFSLACTSSPVEETAVLVDPLPEACTDCRLTDAHNFQYQGNLDIQSLPVQPYTNITIDWSGLTTSIQGKDINPSEVDSALLLVFPRLQPEEVMTAIATDSLEQSEVGLYMLCTTTEAHCLLDDFGLLGSQPGLSQHFDAEEGAWLVILRNEETLGAVSLVFLSPEEGIETTTAAITDQSAILNADVDLQTADPIVLKKDTEWSLEWETLTVSGQGNPLALHRIDRLELGLYASSLAELEQNFFSLPDWVSKKRISMWLGSDQYLFLR